MSLFKRIKRRPLPFIFWAAALFVEISTAAAMWIVLERFRTRIIFIAPAAGLLAGLLTVFLVLLRAPTLQFKNDPGLYGPGLVYRYVDFMILFGLIHSPVFAVWYFVMR